MLDQRFTLSSDNAHELTNEYHRTYCLHCPCWWQTSCSSGHPTIMKYATKKHTPKDHIQYTNFSNLNLAPRLSCNHRYCLYLTYSAERLRPNRSWSNIWDAIYESWVGFGPWLSAHTCQTARLIKSALLLAAQLQAAHFKTMGNFILH